RGPCHSATLVSPQGKSVDNAKIQALGAAVRTEPPPPNPVPSPFHPRPSASLAVTQWGIPIGSCLQDPPRPHDVTGPTCSPDWLVLQVLTWTLLEGDRVTLHCWGWWNNLVTWVSFYCEEEQLVRNGTELTLFPLQPHHSGRYHCKGWLKDRQWVVSALVTVTVHVAAWVAGALLFLLLLVGVIVAWHWRHCVGM
uniref:FCGR2 protein n=1 Tax=Junco hyemalis TaxID=40217 RepID=A0A8C5J576_JUNHY